MLPQAYPQQYTKPMEEELTTKGVIALNNEEEVTKMMNEPGKKLVLINSVCGCAAGNARPALIDLLKETKIKTYTVFAGVDRQATEKFRSYLEVEPSSPSFYLVEDSKLIWHLPRNKIEGHSKTQIKEEIKKAIA